MVKIDYGQRQGQGLKAEQKLFLEKLSSVLLAVQGSVLEKLQTIHKLVLTRFQATQGTIILLDIQSRHYLILAASRPSLVGQVKNIEPKGITEYILHTRKIFVSEENVAFAGEKHKHCSRALLALPVLSKDSELLGIFYLTGLPEHRIIDEQEKELLSIVSRLLSPYFEMAFWGKQLVMNRAMQREDILADLMTLREDSLEESVVDTETLELVFEEGEEKATPEDYLWYTQKSVKKSGKKKATYYLQPEVHTLLTEVLEQSKGLLPRKTRVSKSEIVNWALEFILSDFSQKGEQSLLIKKLRQKQAGEKVLR